MSMSAFDNTDCVKRLISNLYSRIIKKKNITGSVDYESIEYFASSIFDILFDCNLINLNENRTNAPYIDLIDSLKGIGIQVTIEQPNENKVEHSSKSFKEYGINTLIVFFFYDKKCKIKDKSNIQIWTLKRICDFLKGHPDKCAKIIKVLKIWDDPEQPLPSDIFKNVSEITNKEIKEIIRIKRIDESLVVDDECDKKNALLFCGPKYGKKTFESLRTMLFESDFGCFLLDEEKKDGNFSFKGLTAKDDFWKINPNDLDDGKNDVLRVYKVSKRNLHSNNYFQFEGRYIYDVFQELIVSNNAVYSNIMSIIRGAGQGKTVFCCRLAQRLIEFGVPCFFIARMLHSGGIYSHFKTQIERIAFNSSYKENLLVIAQYTKIYNRPLIIIIDALNEYENTKNAINDIGDILKDCENVNCKVKIVISSRNKIYEEFSDNLECISGNVFCSKTDILENEKIICNYFKKYEINNIGRADYNALFRQSRLFIKLYCEICQNGINCNKSYDRISLFREYFKVRAKTDCTDNLFADEEEFFETIERVARLMIKNNTFEEVSMMNFNKNERENIKKLADGDVFAITKTNTGNCVKFAFEQYRDYFLANILKNNTIDEIDKFLKNTVKMDGLIKNIVFYLRSDQKINKKENMKYDWFFEESINLIPDIPIKDLDEIDKETILRGIDEIDLNNMSSFGLYRLVYMFVDPKSQDSVFKPENLLDLRDDGLKKAVTILSSEHTIYNLLESMKTTDLNLEYLRSFIRTFACLKIHLSNNNTKRLKSILVKYISNDIAGLKISGFNKCEIEYMEVIYAVHSN